MKLISDNLFEFKKGLDPVRSLGIDRRSEILNDLDDANIPHDSIKILHNGSIRATKYISSWDNKFEKIQEKYLSPSERSLVSLLTRNTFDSNNVKKALIKLIKTDNLNPSDVISLIENFCKTAEILSDTRTLVAIIYARISRKYDERKHDKEYNTYAFVGYDDKEPVIINGKKYYEDKFKVESIMKIDKFDPYSLQMVSMMKTRVHYQQDKGQKVYLIDLPKEMMDEERYSEIPSYLQDIFEKYKRRI